MLRMGKSPKQEPTDNAKQTVTEQPTYAAPAQPTTTAPPPHYTYAETPARPAIETPSTPRAVLETESLAREIKDGTMSGFVGGGTTLSGEVVFKGMLRVDGHLTGQIKSDEGTLIVSSGGRVDANINVAVAKINGIINGDIVATNRLELGRAAQVRGDIQTPVLIIEQGAIFEGSCRMKTVKAEQAEGRMDKPRPKESSLRDSVPRSISDKSGAPDALQSSSANG
jgi:cytoskeletal protein CcmA (bactofilin family)